MQFLENEWRTLIVLAAALVIFVKLWAVGERVRKVLDNRGAWERKKEMFRRLFRRR